MDPTTIVTITIGVLAVLLVGGILGVIFARRQKTKNLRQQFGPEYERTLKEVGDREEAEEQLEARVEHVESLDLHPLTAEQKEKYADEWRDTQAKFVDEPEAAIQQADQLIKEVMSAKGYPVGDFEQRYEDISVDYPELAMNYREVVKVSGKSQMEDISTEEMRKAMVHYRALFEELLGKEILAGNGRKEKV